MTSGSEARALALKKMESRKPITGEVPVRLSSETVERLVRAQAAVIEAEELLALAEGGDHGDVEAASAAVDAARAERAAAQEQLDDDTIVWEFESVAPNLFAELAEKYAPSDDEQEAAQARGGRALYGKAFRPALIAATCTFPGFESPEEADAYVWGGKGNLSAAEADVLFEMALEVCTGRREVVDWGKDSARTRG